MCVPLLVLLLLLTKSSSTQEKIKKRNAVFLVIKAKHVEQNISLQGVSRDCSSALRELKNHHGVIYQQQNRRLCVVDKLNMSMWIVKMTARI